MSAVCRIFRNEFARIFLLAPVFAVIILASIIYAAFYPQPYVNEALRNVPIVVVDQDRTSTSRQLIRAADANADIAIVDQYADMPGAERAVFARTAYGILFIPRHFERDLLAGRPSPVAIYGDASYFLIYQRVAGAISTVAGTMGAQIEAARLVAMGVDPVIAGAAVDPLPFVAIPLFNPEGGYATYVLPAAFVLILQQILLIGVGLLGTLPEGRAGAPAENLPGGPVAIVVGKLAAYLAIELVLLPFYLIALPYLYSLPRLGSILDVLLLGIPFVIAVGSLGMVLAAIFRTPLGVQLSMAALGLPFFFLAGFSWPAEAIPPAIRLIATLVPSTTAIDAFISVSQLGSHIGEIRKAFLTLWILALAYSCLAILIEAGRLRATTTLFLRRTREHAGPA